MVIVWYWCWNVMNTPSLKSPVLVEQTSGTDSWCCILARCFRFTVALALTSVIGWQEEVSYSKKTSILQKFSCRTNGNKLLQYNGAEGPTSLTSMDHSVIFTKWRHCGTPSRCFLGPARVHTPSGIWIVSAIFAKLDNDQHRLSSPHLVVFVAHSSPQNQLQPAGFPTCCSYSVEQYSTYYPGIRHTKYFQKTPQVPPFQ